MALILIAYFGTMVSSLMVLMVLLSSVLQPQHHFRQPHPIGPIGHVAALDTKIAQPVAAPNQVTAVPPAAMKSTQTSPQKQVAANWARRQTPHRTRLTKQQPGNGYSTVFAFEHEYGGRQSDEYGHATLTPPL
jgi:hypothetical protein